eukprot:TRINITY_DN6100_c0_g2_i4.p1 TRINITY_DN6100_c0_g2~~TRINITY_DN6100_c0_g2_i4.p1  ORF type:complete len:151 (+),score=29.67 TRINITY_DN6100_c0_g2_i4:51-503(+)
MARKRELLLELNRLDREEILSSQGLLEQKKRVVLCRCQENIIQSILNETRLQDLKQQWNTMGKADLQTELDAMIPLLAKNIITTKEHDEREDIILDLILVGKKSQQVAQNDAQTPTERPKYLPRDACEICYKKVYFSEQLKADGKMFHKR